MTYDEIKDIFHNKILEAIDEAFNEVSQKSSEGWLDKDLPKLFGPIDAHVDTLIDRHNIREKTEEPFDESILILAEIPEDIFEEVKNKLYPN